MTDRIIQDKFIVSCQVCSAQFEVACPTLRGSSGGTVSQVTASLPDPTQPGRSTTGCPSCNTRHEINWHYRL